MIASSPREWSASAVRRWWRDTLTANPAGTTLSAESSAVFVQLLERHPEAAAKRGCGIAYIYTSPNSYGRNSLWVARTDGSREVVGVTPVATGRARTLHEKLVQACRLAVSPSIAEFRAIATPAECAHCCVRGVPLEVDHMHPHTFASILASWPWLGHVRDEDLVQGEAAAWSFRAALNAEQFRCHHDKVAELRYLCRRCHVAARGPQ